MCIGITGSTGVLGRLLIEKLESLKLKYDCFEGDITSNSDVKEWVRNPELNSIIHFAAIVPTDLVNSNPIRALEVNFEGTHNLLKEIDLNKDDMWFFYASTSHVYKSSKKPLKETDFLKPQNLYGETKLLSENLINYYSKISNINFCIGRIFSFYHQYQKKPFLYPSILERLEKHNINDDFNLVGKDNIRDILNAEKVVDIIFKLYEKKYTGTINIGSGVGTSIEEFVLNIAGNKLKITGPKDISITSLVADTSLLNEFLDNNE